jgi:uncharacterized membrane protein
MESFISFFNQQPNHLIILTAFLIIVVIWSHILSKIFPERKWSLLKFVAGFAVPLSLPILYVFIYGAPFLIFIILSASVGTVCEYIVGKKFHDAFGEYLWVYHRTNINKNTSILSIPLWIGAGTLFFILIKISGL